MVSPLMVKLYTLRKNRFVVPELPPRCIDNNKQSQFVACIHKSRVLRIMGIADDTQPRITQLFGIAPMQAVGKGVAHYGKILMTVGTDERIGIRTSVKPESVFPTKLYTPYSPHAGGIRQPHVRPCQIYAHAADKDTECQASTNVVSAIQNQD